MPSSRASHRTEVPRAPGGWRWTAQAPILARMSFLKDISPRRVFGDTRDFLRTEQPYKWRFLALSAAATLTIFLTFFSESGFEKEYQPPEVTWIKSFPPDRTEADIRRDQLLDMIDKHIAEIKRERREKERQEQFKRVGRMFGMDVDE